MALSDPTAVTAVRPEPLQARLLLIEDDPRDVELTLLRLERSDIHVTPTLVARRAELLQALGEQAFDLVLCDFQLPGFSGAEALEVVRALAPELPFIFLSGVLGEELAVEMLRQGATDYVVKHRLERLPIAVRRALNEARERRARQLAERSLREREAYFAKLVDSLKDYSMVALDRAGLIESWNAGSQSIFGYAADEVIGSSVALFYPAATGPTLDGELQRAALEGSSSYDRWLVRRDGSSFHASVVISAIRNEEGHLLGYSHIVRDTTELRQAADLLQAAKEQAEAANSAKDRFLAVLSHELRTPLSPIAAAAKVLEMQEGLAPIARESIRIIQRNVQMETRLIDDLLDISRIVNDKLTLELQDVDLHGLLPQLLDAFAAEARERGVEFVVAADPAEELFIRGDPGRLLQLLGNLVKNALKFTPRGGHVAVRAEPRGEQLELVVEDDGIGIAPDDRERIFRAFEQAGQVGDSARSGLGLGLAIAQSLAQKHGASLSVFSEGLGRGARFSLRFERLRGPRSVCEPIAQAPASAAPLRILLVEDDPDTLRAGQALLEVLGFEVTTASSVGQAAQRLQAGRFDVLLSDLGLPDGTGIDVLRLFRASGGDFAIALTGYGMRSDQQRVAEAGFTRHLVKPLAPNELIELLRGEAARVARQA